MRVSRDGGDRGIVLPMTALILIMAVPLIGLAIDGTLLYIGEGTLQGAADGAALAAARALARGSNDSAQTTSAKDAAVAYVKINFPNNYFFSNSLSISQSDVDVTCRWHFKGRLRYGRAWSSPPFFSAILRRDSIRWRDHRPGERANRSPGCKHRDGGGSFGLTSKQRFVWRGEAGFYQFCE